MKEKKYYNLFNEYQTLISQKEFNEVYYDKNLFIELKGSLLKQLDVFEREIKYEIICDKKRYSQSSILKLKYLKEIKDLQSKIKREEKITKDDYENTYFNIKFLGLFTTYQMLIFGMFLIVLITYKAIML